MRHRLRLRPVRPPHRARFRLTLATVLLPLVAVVLLARIEPARRPLDEREAALAIDVQRMRRTDEPSAGLWSSTVPHGTWSAATLSLVAAMPRTVGNRELQLRLAGIAAGALALGVLVRLGTRLFAPRVGLAAGLLLLALPSGRMLLGLALGAEPFFTLAMLVALLAMREMAEARIAAVFAGVACGVACAVAGVDAVWLPLLALAWLRVHQGLTMRSAGVVLGTTAATAVLWSLLAWFVVGREAGLPLATPSLAALGYLDPALLPLRPLGRELLPLVPLAVLGLSQMRREWWRSESFRFVMLWLVFAGVSAAVLGTVAGAFVALLMLVAAIALLALEHARPLLAYPSCAIALAAAIALWRMTPIPNEGQMLDRWAIREAGRFVGRVIGSERRVAASAPAARRFAYYGNRPVEEIERVEVPVPNPDYVILRRADFQTLRERRSERPRDAGNGSAPRLKRVAEFGNWVVARVGTTGG